MGMVVARLGLGRHMVRLQRLHQHGLETSPKNKFSDVNSTIHRPTALTILS